MHQKTQYTHSHKHTHTYISTCNAPTNTIHPLTQAQSYTCSKPPVIARHFNVLQQPSILPGTIVEALGLSPHLLRLLRHFRQLARALVQGLRQGCMNANIQSNMLTVAMIHHCMCASMHPARRTDTSSGTGTMLAVYSNGQHGENSEGMSGMDYQHAFVHKSVRG